MKTTSPNNEDNITNNENDHTTKIKTTSNFNPWKILMLENILTTENIWHLVDGEAVVYAFLSKPQLNHNTTPKQHYWN